MMIWGTKARGHRAYKVLNNSRSYEVVAFGDNDPEIIGNELFGIPVIGVAELNMRRDIDGIVIASRYVREIVSQLREVIEIPIYTSYTELIYDEVFVDISGCCNAKCKWCVTGRKNREDGRIPSHQAFMDFTSFKKLYNHLYKTRIIEKSTMISLYNWGEPMLNKNYPEIISFLSEQRHPYRVSTNASAVQLLDDREAYRYCDLINFSMPGFSQESYNRIHGFSFEKIKENIIKIVDNVKACGFEGNAVITFHVYKFNISEIEKAKEFADKYEMAFFPKYAYLNGGSMLLDFFEDKPGLEDAEEDMFLSFAKPLASRRKQDYQCRNKDTLTLDWDGSILTCCCDDVNRWGSIFNIHSFYELCQLRKKILNCDFCQKCRHYGIDYWLGNQPKVDIEKLLI